MIGRALFMTLALLAASPAAAADLMTFWDAPVRGGNSFNEKPPSLAYFRPLRRYGATS